MAEKNKNVIPEYDSQSLYPHTKCLSSSQVLTYIDDPQKFYMEYVVGVKKASKKMRIGSLFSACYQNREIDPTEMLRGLGCKQDFIDLFKQVIKSFPVQKGGSPEYPLKCDFMGWQFRATLDDYVESTMTDIENKTGEVAWTQERTNFSPQITFQSWVHWKKTGMPFRKIILNWWNTKCKTRDVKSFKTSRSIQSLKNFETQVVQVVKNIEAGNFSNNIY